MQSTARPSTSTKQRAPRANRLAAGRVAPGCVAVGIAILSLGWPVDLAWSGDAVAPGPAIERPEPSAMGDGGWTDVPAARVDPAGAGTPEAATARISATEIQQALDDQLVAGVARPRIDLNIEFEFNSAELTEAGRADLDQAGEAMSRHFSAQHFILGGHTDTSGPADYNLALSLQRAEAARSYLVSVHGIAPQLLSAQGHGETQPLAGGPPERNRRVVLELVR